MARKNNRKRCEPQARFFISGPLFSPENGAGMKNAKLFWTRFFAKKIVGTKNENQK